ncbi:MAG TPA: hypothetical protein VJT73_17335 [Polyangiaceae bacterium]|nr:hypothetical protein [Polyangiaceae bacterium]
MSTAPEHLLDAFGGPSRCVLGQSVEQSLGFTRRKWRVRRRDQIRGDDGCGGLAVPQDEEALTSVLGGVDELGQVGFSVGKRRFAHVTNMTNFMRTVELHRPFRTKDRGKTAAADR